MAAYIIRRLLLMIPTLFGIMMLNFVIIQAAPGGPVEQIIAQLQGKAVSATARFGGGGGGEVAGGGGHAPAQRGAVESKYRGAQGLDPQLIKDLEKQFGFDKPAPERFLLMMSSYLRFDFGESFFRRPVGRSGSSSTSCRSRSRSGCGRRCSPTSSPSRSASPRRCATARASTSGPRRW